ncbi:MAG: DUF2269 domain-containing protein [Burkholderiaceae bacterium]|nr:DUF2269 domain-containing protein [Burkholderiaceae bacterium]
MNAYVILKLIHILSSVLLVGTGFGSAFYLFFANRSASVEAIATTCRLVVRADYWFTTPAVIVQPITGLWMIHLAGWPLATPWILVTLALYGLTGACWLPVVWLQVRMARMATSANESGTALPPQYWRYARYWERLGYPAFIAMLAVYFLMVVKPALP